MIGARLAAVPARMYGGPDQQSGPGPRMSADRGLRRRADNRSGAALTLSVPAVVRTLGPTEGNVRMDETAGTL